MIDQSEQNNTQIPPHQNLDNMKTPDSKLKYTVIFVVLLLLIATIIVVFQINQRQSIYDSSSQRSQTPPTITQSSRKPNIDCYYEDLALVAENNSIYLVCQGGVIILDVSTKAVVGSIAIPEITRISSVSDILKISNKLYMGASQSTQGLTIIDLQTKQLEYISDKNGLLSNDIFSLARDDDTLWLGTRKGINSLNINSRKVSNFPNIDANVISSIVGPITVTSNGVYAAIHYPGDGIIRYDKNNKNWDIYAGNIFDPSQSTTRMDYIANIGDNIFATNLAKVWQANDVKNTQWNAIREFDSVFTIPSQGGSAINILGVYNGNMYIKSTNNNIYTYNPVSKSLSQLSLPDKLALPESRFIMIGDGKAWFHYFGSAKIRKPTLSWLDLNTLQTDSLELPENAK